MRVGVLLVGMAGLSCATHRQGTAGISRDAYLQHLELCSEEELRRRLEFKFEGNDLLGMQDMLQREGVYLRIKYGRMDGYFAMLGMMLTDGAWHRRYSEVFKESKIDLVRGVGMIKELIHEMVMGDILKEMNRRLVEMAVRKMEDNYKNNAKARNERMRFSNVVYHMSSEVEKRLPPEDREWGRVFKALLRKDGVVGRIVEGEWSRQLRMMDGEMRDVLRGYIERWRSALNDICREW